MITEEEVAELVDGLRRLRQCFTSDGWPHISISTAKGWGAGAVDDETNEAIKHADKLVAAAEIQRRCRQDVKPSTSDPFCPMCDVPFDIVGTGARCDRCGRPILGREETTVQDIYSAAFDEVVFAVAKLIFGTDASNPLIQNIVRAALERYDVPEIIGKVIARPATDYQGEVPAFESRQ